MRWNFWSGEAAPATDTAATTVYVPTLSTAAPAASASTSTSVSTSTTTSASASGEAAGPDATAGEQTAEQAALALRFSATLKDEEKYQEMQFPSYDEVPGCMRLFDEFLMCYALMPQMRNIYRHGELRDCTWKFDDFKYCMSLKGEDVEARRRLWIRRRAEWWARRRVGSSSEDVWEARDKPLENFPPLYEEVPEAAAPAGV